MPNWTENNLTVKGTKERLEEFKEKYLEKYECQWNNTGYILGLSFDKIIPQPKTIEECPEEYIIRNEEDAKKTHLAYDPSDPNCWFNWYKWRCEFWGTKWDDNPVDYKEEDGTLFISFDTAWAPAVPVIMKLIKDNPDLEIKCEYFEGGMWFSGVINKYGDCQDSEEETNEKYSHLFENEEDSE